MIIFILYTKILVASEDFLISDEDFQKYYKPSQLEILLSSNSTITKEDLKFICKVCKKYKISPLVILAKLEQEQSLISANRLQSKNNALGYGSYYKFITGKNIAPTFEHQVVLAVKFLREKFNEWKPNSKVEYKQNLGFVIPKNAATYALYKYCPVYREYLNVDGSISHGNILFEKIFNKFKNTLSVYNLGGTMPMNIKNILLTIFKYLKYILIIPILLKLLKSIKKKQKLEIKIKITIVTSGILPTFQVELSNIPTEVIAFLNAQKIDISFGTLNYNLQKQTITASIYDFKYVKIFIKNIRKLIRNILKNNKKFIKNISKYSITKEIPSKEFTIKL